MAYSNVPDDWGCYWSTCGRCGRRYHDSEGGCPCEGLCLECGTELDEDGLCYECDAEEIEARNEPAEQPISG